jgi:hypothetical protein
MSVLSDVMEEVSAIATDRELVPDRAFGYFFLEQIEEFSTEEAESIVVDGPWDGGRDAVYFDEDNQVLTIYQLKYSEDLDYLRGAFADVQRALDAESTNVGRCKQLRLVVVTIATSDESTNQLVRRTAANIKGWLTRHRLSPELEIQLFDLRKFAEYRDRLFGLRLTLPFRTRPAMVGGTVLGLLNAAEFKDRIDEEALFAFNIRKFLTARKGSVNSQIYETLENPESRAAFWTLNNGIVCLCTSYRPVDDDHIEFENFTIVNGAQTVSTVARFLSSNPAAQDPVWVVAKVIQVREEDVERARLLTKSSNSQAPTSDKDLRAVDPVHRKLAQLFESEFSVVYLYRRGTRAPRGRSSITMKDAAQASMAYWFEKPNISFSRPGSIFSDAVLYDRVFPSNDFGELARRGDTGAIHVFLLRLLVPVQILTPLRKYLRTRTADATERKWRSVSYHVLWVIRKLMDDLPMSDLDRIHQRAETVVSVAAPPIFESMVDFLTTLGADIPRDLKSEATLELLLQRGFLDQTRVKEAKRRIAETLSGLEIGSSPPNP